MSEKLHVPSLMAILIVKVIVKVIVKRLMKDQMVGYLMLKRDPFYFFWANICGTIEFNFMFNLRVFTISKPLNLLSH